MVEVTRTEKVGEDGVLHIALSEAEAGKTVEVTVRDPARRVYRTIGGYEGKIRIAPDFDDPLPEMKPYSWAPSCWTRRPISGRSPATRV